MDLPRFAQSPTDPAFVQDPYPAYDRARAAGDLVWWEEYAMPAAVSHGAVSALLRDRRLGRTPPVARPVPPHLRHFHAVEAHSMLELEAPRHTRLRGLVLRAFTSRRIAALGPETEALARDLLAGIDGPFDLLEAYARPLPARIIARLLGVPEAMAPQLLAWSNAMVAMYQAGRTRAVEEAADAAARDFAEYLRGHVAARRGAPGDDLITHLIAAEADGARLSPDEMIATCILLLNAGHEATVHTLGNGAVALIRAGAPPIDAAVIEEVLRHDPPLHVFTRWAYEDVEIAGTRVPAGTEVACVLGAANRDPAVFAAPHLFDPSRGGPQVAFGAGPHFCVGAPLARLELEIGLRVLFERPLRLVETPRFGDTYHFHGYRSVMVTRDA
ncbi:MAG: cytochrome P450 [Shimia sp.]